MKYNQCHSRFNGELLNGKPLNGFLNGFWEKMGNRAVNARKTRS